MTECDRLIGALLLKPSAVFELVEIIPPAHLPPDARK